MIDFTTLPGNYSTTEVDTGYTWVDGKTIYKKTVDFGMLPDNAEKTVAHDIPNLDFVIDVIGMAKSGGYRITIPNASSTAANSIEIYVNNTNIVVKDGNDRSQFQAYITLLYTKTS